MPLNVRNTASKEFKRVPAGIHVAVCNMVVDCGIQPGGKYKPRHQVYIRWEIPSERVEWTDREGLTHEGPMNIGKFYTASLAEKAALRRDLENWRGRPFTRDELAGFDLFKILGTPCQLLVTHSSQGDDRYANVTGVMAFPREMPKPKAEHRLVKYSPEEPAQFDELPQWLRDKIASSLTAPMAEGATAFSSETEVQDELPFARATR